jgi:hypothetical protein
MHALICLGLALFLAPAAQSPFNSYAVFLSPRQLPGTCADEDLEQFRNRTYTFRSDIYPGKPITLRNGKVIERNPLGNAGMGDVPDRCRTPENREPSGDLVNHRF